MMIYVIIDSRWAINEQLVNLSAVAAASNMQAVASLTQNGEQIFFSYLLKSICYMTWIWVVSEKAPYLKNSSTSRSWFFYFPCHIYSMYAPQKNTRITSCTLHNIQTFLQNAVEEVFGVGGMTEKNLQ